MLVSLLLGTPLHLGQSQVQFLVANEISIWSFPLFMSTFQTADWS